MLGMCKRKNEPALGHSGQQSLPLGIVTQARDQPRTHPHRGDQRLKHQRLPHDLHGGDHIQRAAIETTVFGRQRERGQAQFGQLPPGLGTVAGLGGNDPLSRFEVVVLLGQSRH
jgi:hypothetical protein